MRCSSGFDRLFGKVRQFVVIGGFYNPHQVHQSISSFRPIVVSIRR